MGSETTLEVPVIDFTKLNLGSNTVDWVSARKRVQQALLDYGCFVVKCDQLLLKLHDQMLDAAKGVFESIPKDVTSKNTTDDPWSFSRSTYKSKITMERFLLLNATSPEGATSLESFVQTIWPHGNDGFCNNFLSHIKLMAKLEQILEKMVLESYGVDKYFEAHVESMTYNVQILRYGATRESVMALRPHTDKGFITILDTNHVKGLEIKTKDGDQWLDYKPAPEHVIVIAGDALYGWSNGRLQSPLHRVVYGGDEDRYTIKVNSFARKSDLVEVPKELVDDEHPLLFKPFSNFGYVKFCSERFAKSAGQNDLKTYCGV